MDKKTEKIRKPGNFDPGLSSKTVRSIHVLLYCSFTQAVREGFIPKTPLMDVKQCSISITKTMLRKKGEIAAYPPKTRNSIRRIVISKRAVELLLEEHSQHPKNPYMFPSPVTGTMYDPDAVGRIHKKLLKEAGLEDCRFHDLRHTFATLALQNGVDIKTLSGILGHSSSGFTLDTYTHVTMKMQQEAANKMDQFMKMKL